LSATSLLNGLLGPAGIGAGQAIGGMSGGAVGEELADRRYRHRRARRYAMGGPDRRRHRLRPRLQSERLRARAVAGDTARAGKAFDRLFVYGTGGFASFGAANNLNAGGFDSMPNFVNLSAGNIDWSTGGGMELSLDKNMSAKIEYLHNTPTSVSGSLFDNDAKNNIVRGGIDYRLPVGTW
jgi:opacity protein-like surface antigen